MVQVVLHHCTRSIENKNVQSHPLTCEDDVALFVGQKFHNEADWKSPTLYLDPYTSTVDHKIAWPWILASDSYVMVM